MSHSVFAHVSLLDILVNFAFCVEWSTWRKPENKSYQGHPVLLEKMHNSHLGNPDYSFNVMGYILSPVGLPSLDISEYFSCSNLVGI